MKGLITIDYQHYNSFNLTYPRTGKKENLFDDYGGEVINVNESYYERECMPRVNMVTDKSDIFDGERYINATYSPRTLDVTCFFSHEQGGGDLTRLKKWLFKQHKGKKQLMLFEFDGDDEEKGIYVLPQGGFNSQVYYQKKFYGQLDLKFIAPNPYWFIVKKEEIPFKNLVAGNIKNVGYKGNTEAYPLIKVIPNTTNLVFKWNNDLIVTLQNLIIGREYYIDSEYRSFYYLNNGIIVPLLDNIVTTKYREFPLMDADITNTLTIINGGGSFYINPRTRII